MAYGEDLAIAFASCFCLASQSQERPQFAGAASSAKLLVSYTNE
jgi:hypothetical protein